MNWKKNTKSSDMINKVDTINVVELVKQVQKAGRIGKFEMNWHEVEVVEEGCKPKKIVLPNIKVEYVYFDG